MLLFTKLCSASCDGPYDRNYHFEMLARFCLAAHSSFPPRNLNPTPSSANLSFLFGNTAPIDAEWFCKTQLAAWLVVVSKQNGLTPGRTEASVGILCGICKEPPKLNLESLHSKAESTMSSILIQPLYTSRTSSTTHPQDPSSITQASAICWVFCRLLCLPACLLT